MNKKTYNEAFRFKFRLNFCPLILCSKSDQSPILFPKSSLVLQTEIFLKPTSIS